MSERLDPFTKEDNLRQRQTRCGRLAVGGVTLGIGLLAAFGDVEPIAVAGVTAISVGMIAVMEWQDTKGRVLTITARNQELTNSVIVAAEELTRNSY